MSIFTQLKAHNLKGNRNKKLPDGPQTPSQGYVFKIWVSAPIVDRVKSLIIPFGSQLAVITETLIFS